MARMTIAEALSAMEFPGDGILAGKTADGTGMLTAYFICSEDLSRRFVEEGGGVVIEPIDQQIRPSLVYQPALTFENKVLIGNGTHTEHVYTALSEGLSFGKAVKEQVVLEDRPRLTALVDIGDGDFEMDLRITKSATAEGGILRQSFKYAELPSGYGYLLCSNRTKTEPFGGEPICLELDGSIFDTVAELWENLPTEFRTALWVRMMDMNTHRDIHRIINRVR